jgi:DNA (cytosine-5)-methyltransferase 1|tara:strand:+ start:459 stop:1331 length:873 start_codon:yes stop_codon:yes gene_type:complete
MSGKPTVISTFAGCGGSSLGYKWAGFDELLAVEWENNAVQTFKLNFPDVPVWQRDIREISGKEILEFTKLKQGQLDVLDGSPPCQGFSTAKGKRNVSDDRNDLTYEFIRLIEELQPKVFVMENVSGMVKGTMKGRFKQIMKALKSTGYNVKCKLMNSMYYKVPQSRQRLIWIGAKEKDIKYPTPKNNIKNVFDVLPHIKEQNRGQFDKSWITSNKPSYTITKTSSLLFKDEFGKIRKPTINDLKILSSFPQDFQFIGSFNEQWARIGNAVMPKFMEHIARTIKTKILGYY